MEDSERQQLLDENASLRAEIVQLKQTIDALVRRIFGAKSETLEPAQLELLLGADLAKKAPAAAPADPGPAAEIPSHKKPVRRQARAPRIPEHLPVSEETILEPAEVLADPSAWRRIGEETREQLHYQRGSFSRIRTVRPKYVRIGDPLTKPVIAPLPPSLQDRCIATPALIAEVLDNRFVCHLPYYRQAEMFTRLGVNLHRKTLCDWVMLASDWLAIIYRAIQHEHWRCTYRQLDETPINYLEPGHGKTKTGYLWVSNIPGGSVLYHWRKGRDQGGITDLFDSDPSAAAHPTVIQSDGYSAYPAWAKGKDHITLMGCHAHVRRKFFEAQDQSPRLVAWILRQLAHLYQIESRLRETRSSPVQRETVRAAQSRPIHQRSLLTVSGQQNPTIWRRLFSRRMPALWKPTSTTQPASSSNPIKPDAPATPPNTSLRFSPLLNPVARRPASPENLLSLLPTLGQTGALGANPRRAARYGAGRNR